MLRERTLRFSVPYILVARCLNRESSTDFHGWQNLLPRRNVLPPSADVSTYRAAYPIGFLVFGLVVPRAHHQNIPEWIGRYQLREKKFLHRIMGSSFNFGTNWVVGER